ncbi:restriction endonuclease subunit S [Vibrio cholerae]|nr:restriction endonuclease subunit S [Vibrio cholerae]
MKDIDTQVLKGYKQTDIGLIPADWSLLTIDEVATFSGGAQPPRSEFISRPKAGYVRLIQIRDYKTSAFETYIPLELARKTCNETDIMIGRYGPPIFQILRGIKGAYNVALIKASPKHVILNEYLYHFLKSDKLFELMEILSQRSSGQTGIELPALKSYPIPLPAIEEQTAIANALSDVDALIRELEKLIAKKQAIKTATMQQLLTGKKRLPQFAKNEDGTKKGYKKSELGDIPEDWDVIALGAASTFINGRAYALDEWEKHGTPVIRLQNLTGRGEQYYYSNLQLPEKQYCNFGDLLFMWSATFGPVIWRGTKAIYHYHIWKIVCESGYSKSYLFYLLSDMTEKLKRGSSSGGTMLHVTKEKMETTEAIFPPLEEQVAIASILSDMDSDIQALEQRLSKTRQIKQGMMQELLTGKTRLVKPESK